MINYKKAYSRTILSIFFVFSLVTCATSAQNYNGLDPKGTIPFMQNVRHGALPNGLTYYIYENKKPENRAYLTLAVNAGSVLEDENERGLAHFVEHMAFNGTARFPESDLVEYLRSLGMRFGADVNAGTSFDSTVYGIEVPVETDSSGTKRIPFKALDIIDDWTYAVTFDPKDVDEERPVIMEEYRAHLGAWDRLQKKFLPALFEGSIYAQRDPIGLPEIIQTAPAATLSGFYKKWYVPQGMALILVGDFDGAVLETEIVSHFTSLGTPSEYKRPEYFLPPPKDGSFKYNALTDPELTQTSINIFYKHRFIPPERTVGEYRKYLLDVLVDRILSARFDEETLKPEAPFIWLASGNVNYVRNSLHYSFNIAPKQGKAAKSIEDLYRIKETISRYGFSEAEVDRAKRSLLSSLDKMNNEKEKRYSSAFINIFTGNFLKDESAPDIDWELETTEKLLPGISAKELQNTFKKYFSFNDILIFVFAPQAEQDTLPDEKTVLKIIRDSVNKKIEKPADDEIDDDLLDGIPEAGSIIKNEFDNDAGIERLMLSNGAEVILKETNNQNDQIVLYALARGGITSVPLDDIISARVTSELLNVSGLGNIKLTELTKKLAGKQVSFSFNLSSYTRNIQASSSIKDLQTLFEMIHIAFTNQTIDKDAASVMIDQYKTELTGRKENPESFFGDEIAKLTSGGNQYFLPFELDDISKININTAKKFAEKCCNPADWLFVFTGNIDNETIKNLIEIYIASIPQSTAFNEWADVKINRPEKIKKIFYKGKEDKSSVYSGRYIKKPFSETDAMTAYVLDEYIDIILIREIREKLGSVYSIYASVQTSPLPPGGELIFETYFGCDPKRADELIVSIEAELKKIADGKIDAETLTNAKSAQKKSFEQSLQSNLYISRVFSNYAKIFQLPLSNILKRQQLLDRVSANDLQAMMRTLLQKEPVSAVLYPENFK